MPSPHQGFENRRQRCTHPFLNRQPDDQESAARQTTAVREAKKVECSRLFRSTFPALLHRISTESNQPCFVRVEFQFEFGKTLPHGCEKALRITFILKTHHTVVGIAHKDDIAISMPLPLLMRPLIQRIVKINIGKQW